ncbi:ABC-type dipeptide/oligopeptide/nickel transport system permease component [Gaiella occulta]|uniref:ABC-type dipeptide/oligopeptide/nickel transport system permease component n=1 Tax=Gaiella occulta TaxID=1002870 RepID=A0A7M2YUS5_9ACTN|nr:ABC transporter permease [Gaiella occulta]RDI73614.1 ABC-type dipeptide/oligopeptide/nickel transport system permease component [Gaiella occulta]
MLVWILRRALLSLLVLFGVSVLIFLATQALPGDPAVQILGHTATPEQLDELRKQLGLDQSLLDQYLTWLGNVLTGSLGQSLTSPQSVSSLLIDRGLASLALVLSSALIAIPLAVVMGSVGAVRRDRPLDHATQGIFLVLTALPEFVIGLGLLILLGTTVFKVLPTVALIPSGGAAFTHPKELALPVLTLVLAVLPYLTRLQRAAMIDVLESDFIQMARLKGLPERVVVRRHALRNSLVPVVQGSALTLIYLTGGIVAIEYLFAYPGLGSALTTAVAGRDLPVVQAIVLLLASVYVVVNLVADLLTVLLVPRLRTRRA